MIRNEERNNPIENLIIAKLMLKKVKAEYEKCINELEDKLHSKTKDAVKLLLIHLNKNTEQFTSWSGNECPDEELTTEAEHKVEEIIKQKFELEIDKWEAENRIIKCAHDSLMKRLKKYSDRLEFQIKAAEEVMAKKTTSNDDQLILTTAGKVALGLTSPIWFPLAVVGGIFSLPVLGGIAVKNFINKVNAKKLFKDDKKSYITERSRQFFKDHVSEDGLEPFITPKFEIVRINLTEMKSNFERLIEADVFLIQHILEECVSLSKAAEYYAPINADCDKIRGELSLYTIEEVFPSDINITDLQWNDNAIGSGSFADVFKGSLKTTEGKSIDVAVKVCKEMLTERNAHDLLSEELMLRYWRFTILQV